MLGPRPHTRNGREIYGQDRRTHGGDGIVGQYCVGGAGSSSASQPSQPSHPSYASYAYAFLNGAGSGARRALEAGAGRSDVVCSQRQAGRGWSVISRRLTARQAGAGVSKGRHGAGRPADTEAPLIETSSEPLHRLETVDSDAIPKSSCSRANYPSVSIGLPRCSVSNFRDPALRGVFAKLQRIVSGRNPVIARAAMSESLCSMRESITIDKANVADRERRFDCRSGAV